MAYTGSMADELTLRGVGAVPAGGGRSAAAPGNSRKFLENVGNSQGASAGKDGVDLSPDAKKKIAELAQVDQAVRAHEAAHMAAGGGLVRGGAAYSYQRGPDGKNYAVGGEVSIDTSPVADNPAATLQKAQQIKAAALAPADPSPQDRKVAAMASAMALKAAADLAKKAQGDDRVGGRLNVET